MSTFDDLHGAIVLPALMEAMGESITYVAADGEETELTAIVGPERAEVTETMEGRDVRQVREVTICTDPESQWGGVAAPAVRATATVRGAEYAVEEIPGISANLAMLSLLRLSGHERARPDYRSR